MNYLRLSFFVNGMMIGGPLHFDGFLFLFIAIIIIAVIVIIIIVFILFITVLLCANLFFMKNHRDLIFHFLTIFVIFIIHLQYFHYFIKGC